MSWGLDDRDKALAFQTYEAKRCKGCGTHAEDWQLSMDDPEFLISWHEVCPGCEALEREQSNVREGTKGVKFKLLPKRILEFLMSKQDAESRGEVDSELS